MNFASIVVAVIILLVVVGMYVWVSYEHNKKGLSKGCNGNCGACAFAKCDSKKEDNN